MSRTPKNKAAMFLDAMAPAMEPTPAPAPEATPEPVRPAPSRATRSRAGLKHIGAYLDRETVEKVAILRARLELDNSELVKLAVEELYAKHQAKRAFGDA